MENLSLGTGDRRRNEGRPGPRLADRDARRREGARGPVRDLPDCGPIHTVSPSGSVSPLIEQRRVETSFIQKMPFAARHYRRYLPLFPWAIEQFGLDGYDLVISSSHCAAKAAIPPRHGRHICYCHSPMRYAWDQFDAYFGPDRVGALASRWFYRPVLGRLARWDAATAGRVHRFIANSQHVAGRIRRYYNRPAAVVYPPVDTVFFHPGPSVPENHYLIVSALVPYKRIELAIDACARAGAPLRIVGDGPERASLERRSGAGITFLGPLAGERLRHEYQRARAVASSRGRGFWYRAGRSAGVRHPGRRPAQRRRARNGEGWRDRRDVPGADGRITRGGAGSGVTSSLSMPPTSIVTRSSSRATAICRRSARSSMRRWPRRPAHDGKAPHPAPGRVLRAHRRTAGVVRLPPGVLHQVQHAQRSHSRHQGVRRPSSST